MSAGRLARLQKYLESDPANPLLRRETASALAAASLASFDEEHFDAAQRQGSEALALDPGALAALVVRGSLALARGDLSAARTDFEDVLQRAPKEGRSVPA